MSGAVEVSGLYRLVELGHVCIEKVLLRYDRQIGPLPVVWSRIHQEKETTTLSEHLGTNSVLHGYDPRA